MCQTSISVWFVCRLCRGSFGQVDAFIEHKKQKHFTQFQNTTSIVFEESEMSYSLLFPDPVITTGDHELADENIEPEPPIKIEMNDEEPSIPFNSEIIGEPNFDLVEPKYELITFESEINPDSENIFFDLKPPQQNPFVLLKRLTSEEIQKACVPQHHSTLLTFERKNLANDSEAPSLLETGSNIIDHIAVKKSTEVRRTAPVIHFAAENDLQFECKLCSRQLQSETQLNIHVGICALYHKDRNRFCAICNRKFFKTNNLRDHRLTFHGTEAEKLSLYKFKCQLCPKRFREAKDFRFHLESHEETKEHDETSTSTLPKCSHPNCGRKFRDNSDLQRHVTAVHLGVRPFSCSFPNCSKKYSGRRDMERHFRTHSGERPYKCTVDNCNEVFSTSDKRSYHRRRVHRS